MHIQILTVSSTLSSSFALLRFPFSPFFSLFFRSFKENFVCSFLLFFFSLVTFVLKPEELVCSNWNTLNVVAREFVSLSTRGHSFTFECVLNSFWTHSIFSPLLLLMVHFCELLSLAFFPLFYLRSPTRTKKYSSQCRIVHQKKVFRVEK